MVKKEENFVPVKYTQSRKTISLMEVTVLLFCRESGGEGEGGGGGGDGGESDSEYTLYRAHSHQYLKGQRERERV